jgi:hypothetical protein
MWWSLGTPLPLPLPRAIKVIQVGCKSNGRNRVCFDISHLYMGDLDSSFPLNDNWPIQAHPVHPLHVRSSSLLRVVWLTKVSVCAMLVISSSISITFSQSTHFHMIELRLGSQFPFRWCGIWALEGVPILGEMRYELKSWYVRAKMHSHPIC